MANTRYTGADLVVLIDNVEALASVTVNKTRQVVDVPAGNKIGKMHEDGQLDIQGTIKFTYFKGDLSRRVTGGNVTTGTVKSLVAAGASLNTPGALTQAGTDAGNGIVQMTIAGATTAQQTVVTFYGTDVSTGLPQQDYIIVPAGTIAGTTFNTKKTFATVTRIDNAAAAGAGVTAGIASIAGASSVAVGRSTTFDLVVKAIKTSSGNNVTLNMPGCFFTKESFDVADANAYLGQSIDFTMKDCNLFNETYLD